MAGFILRDQQCETLREAAGVLMERMLPADRFAVPLGARPVRLEEESSRRIAGMGNRSDVTPLAVYPVPLSLDGRVAPAFEARQVMGFPVARVAVLAEGRILPRSGMVMTHEGRWMPEVCRPSGEGPREWGGSLRPQRCRRIAGVAAALTAMAGNPSFYHFFIEALPRILLYRSAGVWDDVRTVVVQTTRPHFVREALEILAPGRRIVSLEDGGVCAESLCASTFPGPSGFPAPAAVSFLRENLLQGGSPPAPRRRLYVSRGEGKGRGVVGEADLVRRLEMVGFEAVDPSELSLADQVRMFAEARWIVGPHGGALTTCWACSADAGLVEMFPPGYVNPCLYRIVHDRGMAYRYRLGDGDLPSRAGIDAARRFDPIRLDAGRFAASLAAWIEEEERH